jgi:integrase/recombinase XerD
VVLPRASRSFLQSRHPGVQNCIAGSRAFPITVGLHLSAIRKLATEGADNGLLDAQVAAAIARIRGPRRLGRRIGNWRTDAQAAALIKAPEDQALKGARDQAILAATIGCGLRRSEVASLEMDHLKLRDERWLIADLVGKHGRVRTVSMPAWVRNRIDIWLSRANILVGRVFRPVNKADVVNGESMTSQAVVRGYQNVWLPAENADCTPRPKEDVRQTRSRQRCSRRADSIQSGARFLDDHGAVSGAPTGSKERSR